MKNIYIKKSLLIAVTFFVITLFVGICNASTTTVKTIKSIANFTSIDPKIEHDKIESVLANGILNAKVYTFYGDADYSSGTLFLEYKLPSGTEEVIELKNVMDRKNSYLGTPKGVITKEDAYIDYRIKGVFKVDGNDFIVYAPTDASATEFSRATIVSKIDKDVDGSAGDTISVFCGDQSKEENGFVIVTVPPEAYSGTHKVIVDFLDESSIDQGTASSKVRENVISNVAVDVEGVSEISSPIQIQNLPLQQETKANKFFMQYQVGTEWDKISNANLSVNKKDQLYSFSAANLGHYRVLESITLSNSSYRPDNRIVVKAKIGNAYPGFEFKYLNEGDTVTIYNLKGRKIRKISADGSSDTTVWDGTRDNGDWAESGTYIYQIKLKDGGKVISGTIAFVW
jgi:hypothetical protein